VQENTKPSDLGKRLQDAANKAEERRPNPKDFAPGVVVEPDLWTITTGPIEMLQDDADFARVVDELGVKVPSGWRIRVKEMRFDPAAWTRQEQGDDAVTRPVWRYKFAVEPVAADVLTDEDFDEIRKSVAKWKPTRRTLGTGLGPESVLHVSWADLQIGKSGTLGDGGTIERFFDSLERTQKRLKDLRKLGRNVTGVAIANMGDPVEGVAGNYSSQTFTVELTQRQQLLTALDIWTKGIFALLSGEENAWFISCLCNHGEWTRQNGKAISSDSDNASGFLGDALRQVLAGRDDMAHIQWHLPHDEMITFATIAGVPIAHAHGHKAPSKEDEWLSKQSINLLREYGSEPKLWVTAHRHHAYVRDMGPYWRIQCPSLDAGSKWFQDVSGNWSSSGISTMLVGAHSPHGFSDWAVL
jgi:hypothetical protein